MTLFTLKQGFISCLEKGFSLEGWGFFFSFFLSTVFACKMQAPQLANRNTPISIQPNQILDSRPNACRGAGGPIPWKLV